MGVGSTFIMSVPVGSPGGLNPTWGRDVKGVEQVSTKGQEKPTTDQPIISTCSSPRRSSSPLRSIPPRYITRQPANFPNALDSDDIDNLPSPTTESRMRHGSDATPSVANAPSSTSHARSNTNVLVDSPISQATSSVNDHNLVRKCKRDRGDQIRYHHSVHATLENGNDRHSPKRRSNGETSPCYRILLAEDSLSNQKLMSRILERVGHSVTAVSEFMQG